MEYPKPIMKRSELLKMGFPEEFLDRAYRVRGQTFAVKLNPMKQNSPIIFQTEEFEQWRQKDAQTQERARRRHVCVV